MRKHNIVVAIVAAAALTLASAGSVNAASKTTVLTVVSWKGEGSNVADMPKLNAAFEKAYPSIKLQYKYVDRSNFDTYNNPRFAAGTAADVIMLDRVLMNEWTSQGFLADLSNESWVKRMLPNLKPFNQVGGKTYQFNAENIPIGLYVNNDLLKQAGITKVPTTWPDFISALQTLKAKNLGGFIVPNKGGWLAEQLVLLLSAHSVSLDWPAKYDAGTATFNPSWVPVVDKLKQLFSTGVVDPSVSLGLDPNVDALPQFEAGKWAFMIQGAWALNDISKNSKFSVTLNAFPGGNAGTNAKAFNFVGVGWGMNAKAKNSSAAKKYINFMTLRKQVTTFLAAEAAFTTLKDVPSPAIAVSAPITASIKAGNIVPSFAEELNAPDAEQGIQKAIQNAFLNPTAPTSDTISQLNSLVKPTKL